MDYFESLKKTGLYKGGVKHDTFLYNVAAFKADRQQLNRVIKKPSGASFFVLCWEFKKYL